MEDFKCTSKLVVLLIYSFIKAEEEEYFHFTLTYRYRDGEVDTRGTYTVLAIARILNILTPGNVHISSFAVC
jgi:prenyltransferase beta subunit